MIGMEYSQCIVHRPEGLIATTPLIIRSDDQGRNVVMVLLQPEFSFIGSTLLITAAIRPRGVNWAAVPFI